MSTRRSDIFTTVRTEGNLLPADLLVRLAEQAATGKGDLKGVRPDDYHLAPGEKIGEAIGRAWNRALAYWQSFTEAAGRLPEVGDAGTTPTREKWLLPLFADLGYGRLTGRVSVVVGETSYPVSHGWQNTPIHLVGCRVDLDSRTPGVRGASGMSPHGLVQELLNRSPERLWGVVSNGNRLRLLRDNSSLTRQAFVEFDLEAMLAGEVYADFALLWLLLHESRVEAEKPEECWLEAWTKAAANQGTRALEKLRKGVEAAITHLGQGFLAHRANGRLRDDLSSNAVSTQDYYRHLLRLVYRMLFLFVAEERDLLLLPSLLRSTSPTLTSGHPAEEDEIQEADTKLETARGRYLRFYSVGRLRKLAERRAGTRHDDLYAGLLVVMEQLGADEGCAALALPGLGSFLWDADSISALAGCRLENHYLLDAVRALAFTIDESGSLRLVDYKNLGTEELGSVYESLLELHPLFDPVTGVFSLTTAGGNERKTTGSYYTPSSLISCLLDSALDPALDEAAKKGEPAILDLKVCDPACGSGHFLIAASHRIAHRLAAARTGEDEPAPEAVRIALRDVIGRCVYGVDINPMAVELCIVGLWMEAMVPGKALSYLEHHIVVGNSLLGTTPALLNKGIPDDAFAPIEGDDKIYVSEYKRKNKEQRLAYAHRQMTGAEGQTDMFDLLELGNLSQVMADLDIEIGATVAAERRRKARFEGAKDSGQYRHFRFLADAWCAAFVWKKAPNPEYPFPITDQYFREWQVNPWTAQSWQAAEVVRLAEQYQFHHWHLAFPQVFLLPKKGEPAENAQAGWSGGFDVVLGNPPWERVKLQEKEWFAHRQPEIANARNAAERKRLIRQLAQTDTLLYSSFCDAQRHSDGEAMLIRQSGQFPLCGRGDINTYAVFSELAWSLTHSTGASGIIVPSGIASDDTTNVFFQELAESGSLRSLYSFENEEHIFPAVHHFTRFCLIAATRTRQAEGRFIFYARTVDALRDPNRVFSLSPEDFALLNPNTRTCPIFRSARDAYITKGVYLRIPVLIDERSNHRDGWHPMFLRMFDMANDSALFAAAPAIDSVSLYEAKLVHHFDHRFSTYAGATQEQLNVGTLPRTTAEQKSDFGFAPTPRYWIGTDEVNERLRRRDAEGNITWEWAQGWLIGWRDVTNTTNERTVIAGLLPRVAVGHKLPLALSHAENPIAASCLVSNLSAFVLDYIARQKVGGTSLTYFYFKQFPILPPNSYERSGPWARPDVRLTSWIASRALELTYTAHDMAPFARGCGYDGDPFIWNDDRRFQLRCELDAAYFHLYGINRDDADYIMDTFPIVRRKDEAAYGEYRTKRVILEIYDALAEATRSGVPYVSPLDPPPAHGWMPAGSSDGPAIPISDDIHHEIELPAQRTPTPKANIFFQRSVLGAEIVSQMHRQTTFGHVKFMKTFEICELDADLGNLETQYYRQAAGPLDNKTLRSLDRQLERQKWFRAERRDGRVLYVPLANVNEHRKYFDRYWGAYRDAIQRVITLFSPLTSRQAEIVATLYTAWNDLLLAGKQPTDADIVHESSEQWHEAKAAITPDEWTWGLQWIRRNDLLPRGTGQPTKAIHAARDVAAGRPKRAAKKTVSDTKPRRPRSNAAPEAVRREADSVPAAQDGSCPGGLSDSTKQGAAGPGEAEFELTPTPVRRANASQPALDLPTEGDGERVSGLGQSIGRVRVNGQGARVLRMEPSGTATRYIVVLDGEKAPRVVMVPPARVERE
jgi:hypothetical protein